MKQLQDLPAWQQLWAHFDTAKDVHMRDLFERDPNRGVRYFLEVGGLKLDYSKNRITDETLAGLMQLAREAGVPERMKQMLHGEKSIPLKIVRCCMLPCATAPIHQLS